MSRLPTYEETQEEITACPLYENVVRDHDNSLGRGVSRQQQISPDQPSSYQYPSLNPTSSSRVRLQVSLPPAWPSECATLTNYRYQSIVDHYSLSEPVLLLDRNGRPLRPGRSGSADPFLQQRIGDFLHTQEAIEHDIHATSPYGSETRVANGAPRRYEFSVEREDDSGNARRRRERTCAKGLFVVSLIISAIALIVFLVIAVLKSVHIF